MEKNSEALYRALLETTLDGILIVDNEGRCVEVNESLCRLLKAPRDRLIGAHFSEFIPPGLQESPRADFGELIAAGSFTGEFSMRALDGSLVELEWSSRANVLPGLHFCVARDITARKQADRERERQRQWLQTTLASIGDAVIATDAASRVIFMNAVAERLTGWAQSEAGSRPLPDVFRIINELTRAPVPNPIEKVFSTGVVVGLANHTVLIARDGQERAIDDSAAPIRHDGGQVEGAVLVFRDVTERRRLDLAARYLASIVESSDDAIVSKDLNGIVTSWNKAAERIFGYTAEEMIGQPIALLVPPERPDEESSILARLRRGERIDHYETVRVRKDGSRLHVSVTISPIRDPDGHIIGASKVARDITREKALRDELERRVAELAEADRRKDQFLAMLAHELRNPLGAISNAVHVLLGQVPSDGGSPDGRVAASQPAQQRAIQVLRRQVQHQARIVNELLVVSRLTRGLIELRPEPLDLGRLVRDVAEDYRLALQQEQVALELALPESPLWVNGDPTRLAQVVSNLLSNALKFTPAGGRVTVSVVSGQWSVPSSGEGGDSVVSAPSLTTAVVVRDTGIGIEPELLPHIFDSFSQGDQTLARSHGGLGLGLAIARGLVELHGGTVSAESAGPGHGTTMRVVLPRLLTAGGPVAKPARRPEGKALRVLVIEDHPDAAETLKDLLEMSGYEVRTALTGPDGVRLAHEYDPDVVLCDLGLPGMDGYEVAAALRTAPGGRRQRLVAVTGYGQDEDRRRSREAGFQYHLVKPIDLEELRAVLAALASDMKG
jgi:PAS domain S-box-containing protein